MEIDSVLQKCFEEGVLGQRSKWSLLDGQARKLDPVNHVLRVILQLGLLDEYKSEFDALAAAQHEDGGWGDSTGEAYSGVRNTCFAARNLIRANRRLDRDDLRERIERAIRFVMAQQDKEGFFPDRRWGARDATSSSMGLLLYALKERFNGSTEEIHDQARACLQRASAHLESTQADDGSWPDDSAYEAPVGPTSHLLPKMVLFAGRPTPPVSAAVDFLRRSQDEDGSWDHQHVDHTCDATRALLLTASVVPEFDLRPVVEAGVRWLKSNPNSEGLWGTHPGKKTSLIMTCDVLDCFSKFEAYRKAEDLRSFWQ
jgi:prenyltransferase beta subunit